jgi:hypothetical protein
MLKVKPDRANDPDALETARYVDAANLAGGPTLPARQLGGDARP